MTTCPRPSEAVTYAPLEVTLDPGYSKRLSSPEPMSASTYPTTYYALALYGQPRHLQRQLLHVDGFGSLPAMANPRGRWVRFHCKESFELNR